jgi:hypothetical protein
MATISSIVKKFDIYGNYFQLRINNQTKFKTFSGGLLSLITLIVLILCIISFGKDLFERKNPKISIEEGLFQYGEVPLLNGTEYPIKPALMAIQKSFSDIAKIKINYITNGTRVSRYLDECDKDYMEKHFPEYNYTVSANVITNYCFNFNDYMLSDSVYINLSYDECKKMSQSSLNYFTQKGITCNPATGSIQSTFILLHTKQLGFKPDDEKPFLNKTLKYSLSFSSSFYTNVMIYWNLQYLQDDVGWLIDDIVESTNLAPQPEQILQSFYATPTQLPNFVISFYLNDKFKKYNRTYIKLQDVLAALGGFMKLILTLLNVLSIFIRCYLIDLYIIDEKFQLEKHSIIKQENTRNLNASQQSKY